MVDSIHAFTISSLDVTIKLNESWKKNKFSAGVGDDDCSRYNILDRGEY